MEEDGAGQRYGQLYLVEDGCSVSIALAKARSKKQKLGARSQKPYDMLLDLRLH